MKSIRLYFERSYAGAQKGTIAGEPGQKADKRNGRDKAKRAVKAAASGGTKPGKKRKATTDLAEEEMPASRGGSWKRSGELMFALLEEKQKGHFEAEKLELAEEKAAFYERPLGLQGAYVKFLEWGDAEKAEKIEVLEKEKEELLDLNKKEHAGAQKGVSENLNAHLTCLDHYLDLFHLCNSRLFV
jgi:hypothetical protein